MSLARLRFSVFVAALALLALGARVAHLSAQDRPDTGAAETHQSRDLWREVSGAPPAIAANGTDAIVRARRFSALTLDRGGIRAHLTAAPREFTRRAREQPLVISLPTPDGGFERFALRESPVMEPGLAARHPDIKTYSGRGIDNPAETIRTDVTPLGFHASVRGPRGAWYINPYYQRDDGLYVSYYGRDLEGSQGLLESTDVPPGITVDRGYYHPADLVELSGAGFTADAQLTVTISVPGGPTRVIDLPVDHDGVFHTTLVADPYDELGTHTLDASDGDKVASVTYDVVSPDDTTVDPPVGDQMRTYRLALLSDPGYATFFGAANVTAAKVTLINRVTQIYEDETSIRLVLIAGNDALNLNTAALMTGANGPCGGAACFTAAQATSCDGSTLTRTREVIGLLVGASNFDVGHLAMGSSGGGLASLGVVGSNNKAQGCTGIMTPVGDLFAVDYVAHELGHQFAADHTFNGVSGSCSGGNRNAATSWEPGSGSSIMAYAGICNSDDLQPHSDPYWSAKSADEIINYTAAAEGNLNEVQMGVLTGFAGTDSFRLQYNLNLSAVIARGSNFTTSGVQAAIQGIAGWPAGATVSVSALSDTAFTVTFGGTLAATDASPLTLVNCSGCTGYVGEIAKGGPTTHRGTVTATGNNYPAVTAPASSTIPIRTPFALTGSAIDPDGDTLTYLWEQTDRGGTTGTSLVSNAKTNGPLFRQFGTAAIVSGPDTVVYNSPGENQTTTDPTRMFPDLAQILANNTNAETGACPAASNPPTAFQIDCFSEFLPTAGYVGFAGVNASPLSLHFRLTARDGRGGVNSGATTVFLATGAGPFLVTFPNTPVTLDKGSSQTVTWNPANTAAAPVNTANVKISLSIDGGLTYPYTLAANTANDGSQTVVLPDVDTAAARVKVEAIGNIFFDVSNTDFTIDAGSPLPVVSVAATDPDASEATADSGTFTITRTGSMADSVSVTYSVSGLATNGVDYTTLPGSATIPAGQASVAVFVSPIDDTLPDGSETVVLTLGTAPAYLLGAPTVATVTIADAPTTVTVAATDPNASEVGLDPGTFTFTRTGPTAAALTVSFSTAGSTATVATDYANTVGTSIVIPAGQATATATVTPVGDAIVEPAETVVVTLTPGSFPYTIGSPASATVTIADQPVPTVTVAATDAAASEVGPDPGTFTFTRTGPTTAALTVNFTTTGSATVVTDYADVGWTSVIIPVGQASVTKTVTPVTDVIPDPGETVQVTLGPGSYTVGAPSAATVTIADAPVAGVDLAETAVSAPPGTAAPGSTYVVTDTVTNQGGSVAGASVTRYYLSLDTVKGSNDVRLSATRAVPSLAGSGTSTGPTTVTIPNSLAPGVYWQFACADDTKQVTETVETNNCVISASTVQVLLPDLIETLVGNPPDSVAPGGKFTITDTVLNQSTLSAAASTTRYYLSVDAVKGAGDVLMTGKRSVEMLAANTTSPGSAQVTVPLGTTLGTYRVLACADDQAKVPESVESNNCLAAAASVVVGVPDLITTEVIGLPATAAAGTKVTLTDTVRNQGTASTIASKTQYYLSIDAVWNVSDVRLTGSRSVPILAPAMTSAGSKSVTIPAGTPAGTYFALACADDTNKVTEANEANNCVASAGTIVVGP